MASPKTLERLDKLIWVLIFGGLFVLALGVATHEASAAAGWSLAIIGGLTALGGALLIWVRSRLPEDS